ncbi:TonB family protein [Litoribacillus peritrichatus]|uniref:TonB C-terminal domain-containing protein n=1 Tax=Litoribacillus peritrichatus TaxID=718191 RepID=A0ABP7NA94_9GAMM
MMNIRKSLLVRLTGSKYTLWLTAFGLMLAVHFAVALFFLWREPEPKQTLNPDVVPVVVAAVFSAPKQPDSDLESEDQAESKIETAEPVQAEHIQAEPLQVVPIQVEPPSPVLRDHPQKTGPENLPVMDDADVLLPTTDSQEEEQNVEVPVQEELSPQDVASTDQPTETTAVDPPEQKIEEAEKIEAETVEEKSSESSLAQTKSINAEAEQVSEEITAPVQGYSPQQAALAQYRWQSELMAYLAYEKRYPRLSRKKQEEGTAVVRFSMNRRGEVQSASLVQGTRYQALNRESLDLFQRASPLPPPPEEVEGELVELVIPIEFYLGS